nr:MAG TPA: hypothetical protein [Caudoviricetes sp.]
MIYYVSGGAFACSGGDRGWASQADTCQPRMDLTPLRLRQDCPAA